MKKTWTKCSQFSARRILKVLYSWRCSCVSNLERLPCGRTLEKLSVKCKPHMYFWWCRLHRRQATWNPWSLVQSAVHRRPSAQSCRWSCWIRRRRSSSQCRTWWSLPKKPAATEGLVTWSFIFSRLWDSRVLASDGWWETWQPSPKVTRSY